MNGRIDWMEMIINFLPKHSDAIWTDGDKILVKSEAAADKIADAIELLYKSQDENIVINTGYYNPVEDERNNEKDRYTGWYYVSMN